MLSSRQKALLSYYFRDFRFVGLFLVILLIGFTTIVAQYQQRTRTRASTVADLKLTATFNSIGIELQNEPATTGTLRFSKCNDAQCTSRESQRDGLPLWQAGGALYGSVLLLDSGTTYEIEVTPQGGVPLVTTITTKTNVSTSGLVHATTKKSTLTPTHYVTVAGSAGANGSQANPWTLVQAIAAANAATSDMVIQVGPGFYKGNITAINPPIGRNVTFVAEYPAVDDNRTEINAGQHAVIEPNAVTLKGGTSWTKVTPNGNPLHPLYKWTAPTSNIEQLGFATTQDAKPKRLAWWEQAPQMGGAAGFATLVHTNLTYNYGFWVDPNSLNDVYARFPQDADPNTYFVTAGRGNGFNIDGTNVRVAGFEFRQFGAGININASAANAIIDHNLTVNNEFGIYLVGTQPSTYSRDHLIEYNKIYDSSLWGPSATDPADPVISWNFIKMDVVQAVGGPFPNNRMGEKNETSGILSRGGSNNTVIRYNTLDGPFNGIAVNNAGYDRYATKDLDIHDNFITHLSDDTFEPEFQGINWRIWNNRVEHVSTVVSSGPLNYGPIYLFKNQLYRISKDGVGRDVVSGNIGVAATFFKYSGSSSPTARMYIINNTFWADSTVGGGVDGSGKYASGTGGSEQFYMRNNILRSTRYAFQAPASAYWNENYNHFVTSDASRGISFGSRYTTNVAGYQLTASAPNTNTAGNFITASVVDNALNNPTSGDISLKAGSPFVDIGAIVPNISDGQSTASNYCGSAPDLGASESGGSCALSNPASTPTGGVTTPTSVPATATPTVGPGTPTPTGGVGGVVPTAGVPTATLSLSPATGSVQVVNPLTGLPTLTVNVLINTGGASVTNADLSLAFDASKLQVVSITPGSFLPSAQTVGGASHVLDNTNGIIKESIYTLSGGQTGTGIFATIVFTGKAVTTLPTPISFDTANTIVYGTSTGNVLLAGTGAAVHVTAAPTATPVPPTATPTPTSTPTPVPPTSTPVPPTSTPSPTPTPQLGSLTLKLLLQGIYTNTNRPSQQAVVSLVPTTVGITPIALPSQALTADQYGQYTSLVTNLVSDTYSLYVRVPGYLRKKYTIAITSGTNTIDVTQTPLLGGDIVGSTLSSPPDNRVDGNDLGRTIQDYTLSLSPADINGDATVNALDMGLIINNYLQVGD